MLQEIPKMDLLRDEIHQIMLQNMVPLEEKLQSFTNSNSSVEELFEAVAQQYRQKQNQVSAIGKLVIHTIDLLTEQINEKNELVKDYEQMIEQYKIQQQDSNHHVEQCETALEDYKIRMDQLELQLDQMKQLRQKYQIMYQDQLNSKSISDTIDCSKNAQSFQTSRLEDQKYRIQINLLEFQVKQLKLQVNKKDSLVLQKQQLRSHLNQKIKSESQKNQALQNNFKILQQNFRVMVIQNQSLKKTIEELEEINLEKCLATQTKKEGFENSEIDKWNQREKDFSEYLEEQSRLLRNSISQSMLKKKQTQNSCPQPKFNLAFDLQSLCSGTSMLSPHASDIGKSPKNLFFSNHSNILKSNSIKSPKSIISITSPIHKRTKSQISKFKQLSKVKKQIKKYTPTRVIKQQTPSVYRRCLQNVLNFLVNDRLNKQN